MNIPIIGSRLFYIVYYDIKNIKKKKATNYLANSNAYLHQIKYSLLVFKFILMMNMVSPLILSLSSQQFEDDQEEHFPYVRCFCKIFHQLEFMISCHILPPLIPTIDIQRTCTAEMSQKIAMCQSRTQCCMSQYVCQISFHKEQKFITLFLTPCIVLLSQIKSLKYYIENNITTETYFTLRL